MINYDLLLINVPVLSIGTVIGVLIGNLIPEIIIAGTLVFVLLFSL
jgi:uncharacterized membrane protein YfcA